MISLILRFSAWLPTDTRCRQLCSLKSESVCPLSVPKKITLEPISQFQPILAEGSREVLRVWSSHMLCAPRWPGRNGRLIGKGPEGVASVWTPLFWGHQRSQRDLRNLQRGMCEKIHISLGISTSEHKTWRSPAVSSTHFSFSSGPNSSFGASRAPSHPNSPLTAVVPFRLMGAPFHFYASALCS